MQKTAKNFAVFLHIVYVGNKQKKEEKKTLNFYYAISLSY